MTFANERKVNQEADLFLEADLMRAKGAGITGGDPLMKINRTVQYIQQMKATYGQQFHIHLYTSLNLVTQDNLQKLYEAGLDEIRFHMDLDTKTFWPKIEMAHQFSWAIGVEIPSLPHKETEMLEALEFVKDKIDFLNLNELEMADNQTSKLAELGFKTKDSRSYAVQGSLQAGFQVMEYCKGNNFHFPVHLCTAKLKDAVQLANRLKRESFKVRRPFDLVNKEGLLTRGALYLPEMAPGFSYRAKLEKCDKENILAKLMPLINTIKIKLQLQEGQYALDNSKLRILLAAKIVKAHKKIFKKMNLLPAIVKEYPTADQLEIEVELL